MKTIQDYMNDFRIINDPDMAKALEPVKELHAIRLKIQDETVGMTPMEKAEFYNNAASASLAEHGLSPQLVDLSGQGRLKPRQPVASVHYR